MSEWRKIWANGLPTRTDLQNQAVGWLPKGCRSLGRGTVIRFPRIWVSSGKCRIKTFREGMIRNAADNPPGCTIPISRPIRGGSTSN